MEKKEKKILSDTHILIGEIYEYLETFGLERYEPFSLGSKPSDEWKEVSKKFEKIFRNLRKIDNGKSN